MRPCNQSGIPGLQALMAAVIVLVLVTLLQPLFSRPQSENRRKVRCAGNLKYLGAAIWMYFQDYDEVTVPARNWPESIAPYFRPHANVVASTLKEALDCPRSPRNHQLRL